jgi:hypothetical protein
MAYAIPNSPYYFALEYLPQELKNFESGVNDSLSNSELALVLQNLRATFEKYKGSVNEFRNLTDFGQFFKWQWSDRLSSARLANFNDYQSGVIASRSGGITDQFSGFVDRTNIIEIGAGAVMVATGAAAAGVIGSGAAATSAVSLPSLGLSTISLPSLGQAGAAAGAAILDQAKSQAEKEIKNILEPKKIPV